MASILTPKEDIESFLTNHLEFKMREFEQMPIVKYKIPYLYRYKRFEYTPDQMNGCLSMIYLRHFGQRSEKIPLIPRVRRARVFPLVDYFHEERIKFQEGFGIWQMRYSDAFIKEMEDVDHRDVWQIFKKLFYIQNGLEGNGYYLKELKEQSVSFKNLKNLEKFRLNLGKVIITSQASSDVQYEVELGSHLSFCFKDYVLRKGASNMREATEHSPLYIKPCLITEVISLKKYPKGKTPNKWYSKIPGEMYHFNRTFLAHYLQTNSPKKEMTMKEAFIKLQVGSEWLPSCITYEDLLKLRFCPSFRPIKVSKFGRVNSYQFTLKVPVKGEKSEGAMEAFYPYSFFNSELKFSKEYALKDKDTAPDFDMVQIIDFTCSLARVAMKAKALTQRKLRELFMKVDDEVRMLKLKDVPGILKRIPGFDLQFTAKQLRILAEETKKILVVGWSGTGKTTCAVLQMIAIDLLFIAALKVKSGVLQVHANDIQPTGIRSVFITANDILSDQLKNFYSKVLGLVRAKLELKNKKEGADVNDLLNTAAGMLQDFDLAHYREDNLKFGESKQGEGEQDQLIDQQTIAKLKKGEIDELIEFLEEHDLGRTESQQPSSFQDMSKQDFPLFCTVLQYFRMENASNDIDFYKQDRFLKKDIPKGVHPYQYVMDKAHDARILPHLKSFFQEQLPFKKSLLKGGQNFKVNYITNYVDLPTFTQKYYPYIIAGLKDVLQVRSRVLKSYSPSALWHSLSTRLILKYTDKLMDMRHYGFMLDIYELMSLAAQSYDFTDLFYWCYFCVKKRWWNKFSTLYVDEVQDLSDDVIDHLLRLSMNAGGRLVFFGHNAQNIARGSSLKFFDLSERLIMSRDGQTADFVQLTRNFRSHQQIIDFGNSVFKLLLLVAKGDLEIMPNEKSVRTGPKPLLLDLSLQLENFEYFMKKKMQGQYVILVRNEDSKKLLPPAFKDNLCLTVLESKGLEFEDVVLFDFFDSSESFKAWSFLSKVEVLERDADYGEHLAIIDDLEHGRIRDNKIYLNSYKVNENCFKVKELLIGRAAQKEDIMFFNQVNEELKLLYVAITRAKNRVVIYDQCKVHKQTNHPRLAIDKFWEELCLVQEMKVTLEKVEESPGDYSGLGEYLDLFENSGAEEDSVKREWLEKAVNFYRNGEFSYARCCFRSIKNEYGVDLMDAYLKLEEVDQLSDDRVEERDQELGRLAPMFENLKKFELASSCYYRIKNYEKALECASLCNNYEQMGKSCFKMENFEKAAEYFKMAKIVDKESESLLKFISNDPERFETVLDQLMVERRENIFEVFESILVEYCSNVVIKRLEVRKIENILDLSPQDAKVKIISERDLMKNINSYISEIGLRNDQIDQNSSFKLNNSQEVIIVKLLKYLEFTSPELKVLLNEKNKKSNEVENQKNLNLEENFDMNFEIIKVLKCLGLKELASKVSYILPTSQDRSNILLNEVDQLKQIIKKFKDSNSEKLYDNVLIILKAIIDKYYGLIQSNPQLLSIFVVRGFPIIVPSFKKGEGQPSILNYFGVLSSSCSFQEGVASSLKQAYSESLGGLADDTERVVSLFTHFFRTQFWGAKPSKKVFELLLSAQDKTLPPMLYAFFDIFTSLSQSKKPKNITDLQNSLIEIVSYCVQIFSKRKADSIDYISAGLITASMLYILEIISNPSKEMGGLPLPKKRQNWWPELFLPQTNSDLKSLLLNLRKLTPEFASLSKQNAKGSSSTNYTPPTRQNILFLTGFCIFFGGQLLPQEATMLSNLVLRRAIIFQSSPILEEGRIGQKCVLLDCITGSYSLKANVLIREAVKMVSPEIKKAKKKSKEDETDNQGVQQSTTMKGGVEATQTECIPDFVDFSQEDYDSTRKLKGQGMLFSRYQQSLIKIENLKAKIPNRIKKNPKDPQGFKRLNKEKKESTKALKALLGSKAYPDSFWSEEKSLEFICQSPYYRTWNMTVPEQHTVYRMMNLMKTRSLLSCTVRTVYDQYCIALNLGRLGYIHKLKAKIAKKKQKQLKEPIFLLMDAELSLISGNTDEFYQETLDFISIYRLKIGLRRSLFLFLKVLEVTICALRCSDQKSKTSVLISDYDKYDGYLKMDASNFTLNPLASQESKLPKLLGIYRKLMASFENGQYTECQNIVDTINAVILQNKIMNPRTMKVNNLETIEDIELEEVTIKSGWNSDKANQNFADYDSEVLNILSDRAKLEYVSQSIRSNISVFKPGSGQDGNGEGQVKNSSSGGIKFIDYDLLLSFTSSDIKYYLSMDLLTQSYYNRIWNIFRVGDSVERILKAGKISFAAIENIVAHGNGLNDSLKASIPEDNAGLLIQFLEGQGSSKSLRSLESVSREE